MGKARGFTLIELMIVIAILGILLAIAIPAYSDYTVRTKVPEGLNIAAPAKTAVSEYRISTGSWPSSNVIAGITDTIFATYVQSVTVNAGGVIRITYRNIDVAVDGQTLELRPGFTADMGAVRWDCVPPAGTGLANRYVPANCRQ